MTPTQAETLLRNEIASGSAVGDALRVLLEDAELQCYRQSAKTADPYMTAKINGRGEGIHYVLNRIMPVQELAQPGRVSNAAVGAPS